MFIRALIRNKPSFKRTMNLGFSSLYIMLIVYIAQPTYITINKSLMQNVICYFCVDCTRWTRANWDWIYGTCVKRATMCWYNSISSNTHMCDNFGDTPVSDLHFNVHKKTKSVGVTALHKSCQETKRMVLQPLPCPLPPKISKKTRTVDKAMRLSQRGVRKLKKYWQKARHALNE